MPVLCGTSSNGAGREQFTHEAQDHPATEDNNSSGTSSCSNEDADSEWGLTEKSLKDALAINRELQGKLLSELARIAWRKRDNRLEVERCIERSCAFVLQGEEEATTNGLDSKHKETENTIDKDSTVKKTKKRKKKKVKGDADYVPTSDDIHELLTGDENSSISSEKDSCDQTSECDKSRSAVAGGLRKTERTWSLHIRKKFRYDPFRKWTSEYFIDPTGSRPKENEDSIRRRRLTMKTKAQHDPSSSSREQKDKHSMLIPDSFFCHTSQPFTPKEKARLDKWLFQDGNNSNSKWVSNENDDSNDFYRGIAQKIRQEHHDNIQERKKDKVLFPTCLPRSSEDIRLYHLHYLASRYEFTKEESLTVLECVEEATAAPSQNASFSENDGERSTQMTSGGNEESDPNKIRSQVNMARPDWRKICDRVLDVHRRRQSNDSCDATNDFYPITPYQCMVHYKRKLQPQPDGSFTPEEDELLLRYIAAMGPQFVWGYPQITDLASRLFPHKTSRRIYERTHFSQWHPLSKDTIWTKEEEMKLVLAMKIYSDTVNSTGANNGGEELSDRQVSHNQEKARLASEKAALRKTSAHFHPYRQAYKVAKKWERSFSPRFSYKPFSKEEDRKLLAAVRSSAATTPFSEIARKHFPDRSSDKLSQRWEKIAPDKEIIKKFVPSMVRSGLKIGLLSSSTRRNGNSTIASTRRATNSEQSRDSGAENSSGAIFDPSDFVVEVLEEGGIDGQN